MEKKKYLVVQIAEAEPISKSEYCSAVGLPFDREAQGYRVTLADGETFFTDALGGSFVPLVIGENDSVLIDQMAKAVSKVDFTSFHALLPDGTTLEIPTALIDEERLAQYKATIRTKVEDKLETCIKVAIDGYEGE